MNWLTGKRRDGTHVVRWAKSVQEGREPTRLMDQYWVEFVRHLMSFGGARPEANTPSQWAGVLGLANPYTEDGGLFELACFRYIELDYFLHVHHPQIREEFADFVKSKILSTFERALGKRGIYEAFRVRAEGYGRNIQMSEAERRQSTECLIALMGCAGGTDFCRAYEFGKELPGEQKLDIFDYGSMMSAVTAWYIATTPLFFARIRHCCKLVEDEDGAT